MRDLLLLAIHLLVTLAKFLGPGGVRRVAAESLLLKHQLLISNRSPSKIPSPVLLFMPKTKAWPERPFRATHRGRRRDEAPQSEVRLCPHRPADRSRLWHRDRQNVVRRVLAKHLRPEPGAMVCPG